MSTTETQAARAQAQSILNSFAIAATVATFVCNPLDILKTELQAGNRQFLSHHLYSQAANSRLHAFTNLFRGAAMPALAHSPRFVAQILPAAVYLKVVDPHAVKLRKFPGTNLGTIWIAGSTMGLLSWHISTPVELIKSHTQLMIGNRTSSFATLQHILKSAGFQGLYRGGTITMVRDSFGFGWYLWTLELTKRIVLSRQPDPFINPTSAEALLIGGIAGVARWASIYPLDLLKTRYQTQTQTFDGDGSGLVGSEHQSRQRTIRTIAKDIIHIEGFRGFYRGSVVSSFNAFIFNAVTVRFVLCCLVCLLKQLVLHCEQSLWPYDARVAGNNSCHCHWILVPLTSTWYCPPTIQMSKHEPNPAELNCTQLLFTQNDTLSFVDARDDRGIDEFSIKTAFVSSVLEVNHSYLKNTKS